MICGRQDEWSPPAQHESIAARISGAQLTVIDDAGHMAPCERPEAVVDRVTALAADALN